VDLSTLDSSATNVTLTISENDSANHNYPIQVTGVGGGVSHSASTPMATTYSRL
jgi:hypothetical protein